MRYNIFLWALYDFANSFAYIAFFLYFSQWIVIDRSVSDVWFNLCLAGASLILLLTAPFIGAMLDLKWRNITGLRFSTLAVFIFYSLAILFMFANEKTLSLMSFIIGQYFFVLSFIFYTPLLSIIAPKEKRGKVSGYGMAGNFLGNISALFLALPFATGKISLFNMEPHAETLFPLLVAFFVFALPMILFFREPNRQVKKIPVQNLDLLFKQMKFLFSNKNVLLFFLSFILLNGAILTFSNNFPIVLSNLWQAPDTVKTFILLAIVIVSVLGSIVSGYLVDFWGGKKVLIHITIGWIIIMPILALMFSFSYFVATIIIAGFLLGANMTSSRVLMSNLVDFRQHNLAFAFFTIAERTSVIVAPILWGLIATDLTVLGPWRYRLAILSMVLLIALSLPFLLKVKDAYKS